MSMRLRRGIWAPLFSSKWGSCCIGGRHLSGVYRNAQYIKNIRPRRGIRAPLFSSKVGLLLHKRTTFIKSIQDCTVYNKHEAQVRHSGSIVQLKVGLLLHKRTTFIKSIQECTVNNEHGAQARHSGSIVQLKVGLLL